MMMVASDYGAAACPLQLIAPQQLHNEKRAARVLFDDAHNVLYGLIGVHLLLEALLGAHQLVVVGNLRVERTLLHFVVGKVVDERVAQLL